MVFYYNYNSPIGSIRLISDGESLIGTDFSYAEDYAELPIFAKASRWLDSYFSGHPPKTFDFPILLRGTSFQNKVWNLLIKIPYGETRTYKEIAQQISTQMSAQAVGQAISKNPVIIFIPCHRVIGSNGKLVGFSAGIDKKQQLLDLEEPLN